MANNLALAAALLVALVALATATTYTTTVTTTTIDDGANPEQRQQCQQQLQGKQFRSCQRYLSERRSQYDEVALLEMSTDNPEQQSQDLRDCCQQLRSVNEQCRCEAIKHAVRQQQQQHGGSQQGEQMQQVYQKAKNLPQKCQFQRPQQCDIRVIFV